MDALVLPLDSPSRGFVERHRPWHHRNHLYIQDKGEGVDLGQTILHTAAMISSINTGLLKTAPDSWNHQAGATSNTQNGRLRLPPVASAKAGLGHPSTSSALPGSNDSSLFVNDLVGVRRGFSFEQVVLPLKELFTFPLARQCQVPRDAYKRRRPVSDVDGPNTATLGCKKRRLRRNLITSRLSRPFSLPATHIINRESVAMGDKRFLKLAAVMSARRMANSTAIPVQLGIHPSPSSLLRRAAAINRFRLRVLNRAAERGDGEVADLAANAALLQHSQGLGLVAGARFPAASSSSPLPPTAALRIPGQGTYPHPLSQAAAEARSPSNPPRLKTAVAEARISPGAKVSRSPILRPIRSPELRSSRPPIIVDLDADEILNDDDAAFPTSEFESRYDLSDEADDVYADFGVIFGGSSTDEFSDEEGDHYEEYMDDVDGIPWTVR